MIKVAEHIIDCDAGCMPQEWSDGGWQVRKKDQLLHRVVGSLEFDPANLELWLSCNQQEGGAIKGYDLVKELVDKLVLPDNVLDFLLEHPELIPEEWKSSFIYFWGKIYHRPDGRLYMRYLSSRGDCWRGCYGWLGLDWSGFYPAALLN